MRVSTNEFHVLVARALAELPRAFHDYLDGVAVDVEPMPGPWDLREADVDDPRDLLGLYHGVPLTERSVTETARMPDRIVIYQNNIQAICRTRHEIVDQVRTTALHEIGHHFGLGEEELDALGFS